MPEHRVKQDGRQAAGGLQEQFLQQLIEGGTNVSVYLVNGIRLSGRILAADRYMLLISTRDAPSPVYKAAVSTIVPDRGAAGR